MKEPKNLREGLELHLQRGLPVMSYERNGYRTEALSKAGILDLLAAYPAEPVPAESADEWARLDAANADEDARGRVANVLRAIPGFDAPHEEHGYDSMCPLCRGNAEGIADALIAAGLIKGTSDNAPMLSGEELRDASEKVDEWVREGDQAAPVASPERVAEVLAHGGRTPHLAAQQAGALLAAGVFRDEATVKAEAINRAAGIHRRLALAARTRDGQYEHEGIADWLDEHADAIKAGQS